MKKLLLLAGLACSLLFGAAPASANDDLMKLNARPQPVGHPDRRLCEHTLFQARPDQRDNVKQAAGRWTFSTGVLRGHEGAPLVIGDMMYVHTPFPNIVFALDLNDDGKIIWKYEPKQDPNVIPVMCCDTVNRGVAYADGKIFLHQADTTLVALDAKTGKVVWSVANGDPKKGETNTRPSMPVKDKLIVGISRRRVRRAAAMSPPMTSRPASTSGAPIPMGPDEEMLVDPEKTTELGKPIGKDSASRPGRATSGRPAAAAPGAGIPTIPSSTCLLRLRQSLDLEPEAAAGRQQVVDDHLRPRPRYRHGQVGLPDDPA